jgi:hypothetical protein
MRRMRHWHHQIDDYLAKMPNVTQHPLLTRLALDTAPSPNLMPGKRTLPVNINNTRTIPICDVWQTQTTWQRDTSRQ